jgi:hypothetical protein
MGATDGLDANLIKQMERPQINLPFTRKHQAFATIYWDSPKMKLGDTFDSESRTSELTTLLTCDHSAIECHACKSSAEHCSLHTVMHHA